MGERFLSDRVELLCGDCREQIATLEDNSIDAVVTDPPYSLVSIVKRFGNEGAAPAQFGTDGRYARASAGFMGKAWDTGEVAFDPAFWAEVLRVLKPGGHVLAMGGTRTFHRLACAIEDAGFEIRDCVMWVYGSGFPKSHDISKNLDRAAGAEREVLGKIIGGGRLAGNPDYQSGDYGSGWHGVKITAPATDAARQWQGWGTALKPSHEDIVLARKPLCFWDEYHIIGSTLLQLESSLWSMLSARIAANNFGLSQNEYDAACASAQWSADERSNIRVALSEAMGTSRFVVAIISSLSTVSSWKRTWIEGSRPESTSITETELSTTTGLRTLKFLLSKITPSTIIQAHKSGLWSIANASNAERLFNASVLRLQGILELSALAPVLSKAARNSLDAGVSPAVEPIVLARKPLSESTVAANVLAHGTGALNIDATRVGADGGCKHIPGNGGYDAGTVNALGGHLNSARSPQAEGLGRWPANLILEDSEEVVGAFPDSDHARGNKKPTKGAHSWMAGTGVELSTVVNPGDSGSAARFFFSPKADADDRLGSRHPTVKPLDLIQYLVRLITPPNGVVLDPFAGTGTTGEAAYREGMRAVLIEREAAYQEDIRRRMALVMAGPDERSRESMKERQKGKPIDYGPLFSGMDDDDIAEEAAE